MRQSQSTIETQHPVNVAHDSLRLYEFLLLEKKHLGDAYLFLPHGDVDPEHQTIIIQSH